MSEYFIRFAVKKETEDIMLFIDKYWRKGHILSRNRELFNWQYGGNDDRLNMVVGLDEVGHVQGILGFVPYSDSDDKDLALALWKANEGTGFLGIRLLDYLMDNEPHREIVCPGINPKTTKKIYERFGMKVGTMSHWYRLAPRRLYMISRINDHEIPACSNTISELIKTKDAEELNKLFVSGIIDPSKAIPHKSINYVKRRYFDHPVYDYLVFVLREKECETGSLLVFRIQDYNGSRALRLIDCIGNDYIRNLASVADILMEEYDCEYSDFYEAGLEDAYLSSNGWRKVVDDKNIIPDYFAPYECRNIDIYYSTSNSNAVLFKGDGDQDRPS